jgi:hypothetical protein
VTARYITAGFSVDRTIERVGAYFIKRLDLARNDGAVSFDAGFDFHHGAVPSAGEKNFVSRQHPLHRTTRFAREQCQRRLQSRMGLATVTPPRCDDNAPDFGNLKICAGVILHDFRGGMNDQLAARLPVALAAWGSLWPCCTGGSVSTPRISSF